MPFYNYKAVTSSGSKVSGQLAMENAEQLFIHLETEGLYLIEHKEIKKTGGIFGSSLSDQELSDFSSNLKSMIKAGISLIEALECMAEEASKGTTKNLLLDIQAEVRGGTAFSKALAGFPRTFSPVYVSSIAVGEKTGSLPFVLEHMAAFLEWKINLKSDVRQAMIYPSFLIVTTIGILSIMMSFVVPRFKAILDDLNIPLPPLTVKVMAVSDFVITKWPFLLTAVFSSIALYIFLNRIQTTRLLIDKIKISIPVIGPFVESVAISRFVKNLMIPYSAGVEIISCFELMEKTVGNSLYEKAAGEIREGIMAGKTIGEGMKKTGLFPRRVLMMIKVGERSGNLSEMLERIGEQYDEAIPKRVKKVMGILEPTFLIINAIIVVIIALAIILPIYRVNIIGG